MSQGNFKRSKYVSNGGTRIYPVRIQPETEGLTIGGVANAAVVAEATEEPSAKVSGGRRGLGVNCRKVRIQFTATPPTGYAANKTLSVPILQPSVFEGISKGNSGTYLGVAVEVVGKTPEFIN